MGAHQSAERTGSEGAGSRRGSQKAVSRSSSGGDLQVEKPPQPSLVPLEKLAKLLVQKSQKEDGINGITEKSFTTHLFSAYPDLGKQLFNHALAASKAKTPNVLSASSFRAHSERLLGVLDEDAIIELYVRIFSLPESNKASPSEPNPTEPEVTPDQLRTLLLTSYKISADHYPDGPQTCLMINKTLSAVLAGCFGTAQSHSVGFVVRWLATNVTRVVQPIHRYVVHCLSTAHRWSGSPPPVLSPHPPAALSPSRGWLLAAALPLCYSARPVQEVNVTSYSAAWLSRLVCLVPTNWSQLYLSTEHGLGANRFLHHTLGYRGPTIVLFQCEGLLVAAASPSEWRESHQYWGGPDCVLLQVKPAFSIIERGPKLLNLNTHIRGYPKGLRVGADPKKPSLIVNEDFDQITFRGTPYPLQSVEVWGCGDPSSRETQLEIKKWQVKEAEKQRQVKMSAADWMEHPDRYLLEMAGRPQYNNSTK